MGAIATGRHYLRLRADGRLIDVGLRQALCAVHRFDNLGSLDVKALCVITPAAIGRSISGSRPR